MTVSEYFPALAAPIEIGGLTLRNRVAHASITTRFGRDHRVTERLIDYHANRAEGGCAMIVTEPLAVLAWQRDEGAKIRAYDDVELDGLKSWAEAVERHDCRLLGQLQDAGRGKHHGARKLYAFGASALPDGISWTVPRALDTGAIADVVEQFARAAERLRRAGFSGVELSAGHGHLIHQFLSPHSNHRDDCYGGPLENRMRFLVEILQAIRNLAGRPFVIAVKLPGQDGVRGGIDLAEAGDIVARLAALQAADCFSFAQGSHDRSLEDHIPDMHWPRVPYNDITRQLRGAAGGIPVAALGRFIEPVQAEQALLDGVADFVQIGRALITDPAWANKAFSGRLHEARWCVSCNSCWGFGADKAPVACDNNPRVGTRDEAVWRPVPSRRRRRILVIGAGVAGLEAAWIAAARGHEVTVWGSGASYGGKTALWSRLPGSEQVSSVYDYQIVRGTEAGVHYEFGVHADAAAIVQFAPDHVVLATGSTQAWPDMLPVAWQDDGDIADLRTVALQLLELRRRQPGTAVLFDADHTAGTYAAAELMAGLFERVVLATPRTGIAADENLVTRQGIYRRMSRLGVEIVPLAEPSADSALIDGIVRLTNVYSGAVTELGDVALFTYATARIPDDRLAPELRAAGLEASLIGDCYAPRNLLTATAEGHRLGNEL